MSIWSLLMHVDVSFDSSKRFGSDWFFELQTLRNTIRLFGVFVNIYGRGGLVRLRTFSKCSNSEMEFIRGGSACVRLVHTHRYGL